MKTKKIYIQKSHIAFAGLLLLMLSLMISCRKYDSLGFTPGTGKPTITSVHTWSKTDTTTTYDTTISYDASGNVIKTPVARTNKVGPFDSVTTAGNLGNYYIIYGTNLGSAVSVTFNGYTAYFNRALMTDQSIIVQVPSKTPYLPPLANDSLVVTTLYGKASYKFTILAPPPTPSAYSNYDFYAGSQITLSGVGFASVTGVTFGDVNGNTANVTIVSQNDSVMTLQFPSTTIVRGFLTFTYNPGATSQTITDKQELVDIDNAYQIFTDDFQNGWSDGSWASPSGKSTNAAKTGNASFIASYPAGGWKIEGFSNWWPSLPYDPSYTYLVFWVKGGTVTHTLNIETNTSSAGYGQNSINPITVPPNVWTYFKIPLSSIDFWKPGTTLQQLGFFLKGQNGDVDETYYFDDVMLVK